VFHRVLYLSFLREFGGLHFVCGLLIYDVAGRQTGNHPITQNPNFALNVGQTLRQDRNSVQNAEPSKNEDGKRRSVKEENQCFPGCQPACPT
jgi:hypothetical protein